MVGDVRLVSGLGLRCWALRDRFSCWVLDVSCHQGARSTRARASCFGTPSLERGLLHDREQHRCSFLHIAGAVCRLSGGAQSG